MALVPALDLRDPLAATPLAAVPEVYTPASLEAEQALLGAVLYDNQALWRIENELEPEHFFEPFHGRLWAEIRSCLRQGFLAEPIMIAEAFRRDPAFKDLGGIQYLGDLIVRAPPAANVPDYARLILDTAMRRRMIDIAHTMVGAAREGELATDILVEQAEAGLLELRKTDPSTAFVTAAQAGARVMEHVANRDVPAGAMTGLEPLDRQLGPLQNGHMIVIGGRPSIGKSAIAGHLGLRMASPEFWVEARNGRDAATGLRIPDAVGFIEISLEMTVEEMTWRHLADLGFHVYGDNFATYEQIANKTLSTLQADWLRGIEARFAEMPVMMLSKSGLQLPTVLSLVRRQKAAWAREGIATGAVALDNLGLFKPAARTSGRYEAQTEVSQGTKALAVELDVPVIALVQLHRQVESRDDKHPQLSDLRDSGSIEQDADVVLFPYREAYYAQRDGEPTKGGQEAKDEWFMRKESKALTINIAKRRGGKSGQTVACWADMAWNAIRAAPPRPVFFDVGHDGQ